MTTEIILALIAIVAAPLSAWLSAKAAKGKYAAEVDGLRAEVKKTLSEVRGRELDNDKKAIEIIMELVVEPLRRDMKSLQRKLDRFTNAIEKINTCPHAERCPVEHELRRAKEDSDGTALAGVLVRVDDGIGPKPGAGQPGGACAPDG